MSVGHRTLAPHTVVMITSRATVGEGNDPSTRGVEVGYVPTGRSSRLAIRLTNKQTDRDHRPGGGCSLTTAAAAVRPPVVERVAADRPTNCWRRLVNARTIELDRLAVRERPPPDRLPVRPSVGHHHGPPVDRTTKHSIVVCCCYFETRSYTRRVSIG